MNKNNNDIFGELTLAKAKEDKRFSESEYYRIISSKDLVYQVHRPTKLKRIVDQHIPRIYLGEGWQYKVMNALYEYRPDINEVAFVSPEGIIINGYNPPKHREDLYWTRKADETIPNELRAPLDLKKIPQPYGDFFTHLFGGDEASLEYFIYWLIKAIDIKNGRNLTALVLISTPGVGKGVLFSHVIEPLFGMSNASIMNGANAFVNQFNSQFADKQIIMLDEANLTETETLDRFKTLVNDSLEVEKKGKDKYIAKNWLNIMIASNHLDSIRIEEGDRRFSVVNMARHKMLTDFFDVSKLVNELSNEENITKLYNVLMSIKIPIDMNKPFKSAQTAAIKDASLQNWERRVLEFMSDKFDPKIAINITSIKVLQDELTENFGMKVAPGWGKFKALCKRFTEHLEFRQVITGKGETKKQDRCIVLKKPYDTTSFDNTTLLTEEEFNNSSLNNKDVLSITNKLKINKNNKAGV